MAPQTTRRRPRPPDTDARRAALEEAARMVDARAETAMRHGLLLIWDALRDTAARIRALAEQPPAAPGRSAS